MIPIVDSTVDKLLEAMLTTNRMIQTKKKFVCYLLLFCFSNCLETKDNWKLKENIQLVLLIKIKLK